jgi:hypothetical protein
MRACVVLLAAALGACARSLPRPAYAPQPPGALVEVTMPPPPGRVEEVPKAPNRSAVWVDGEWHWRRHKWAWQSGYWALAPLGARLSPWVFVRGSDGRFWMAPSVWRDAAGSELPTPPELAVARPGVAEVVNAAGAAETTGMTGVGKP